MRVLDASMEMDLVLGSCLCSDVSRIEMDRIEMNLVLDNGDVSRPG